MSSIICREDQQRALLAELAELEAQDAQLYARRMVLRADMDSLWNPPDAKGPMEQFGVLELAGTARIGQGRASSQLIDGTRLIEELPRTLAALQAGTMFRETAALLLQQTRNCSPEVTRELERRLLPTITTANTTDVRRLVATLIPEVEADLNPELMQQRHDDAKSDRGVWQHDRGDGMVGVTGSMEVITGRRWALDFDELCRAQKIADDKAGIERTAAQRRADVFAQLPSRFLALVLAIQRGQTEQLRALALADPELADDLEALAADLPCVADHDGSIPDGPEPADFDLVHEELINPEQVNAELVDIDQEPSSAPDLPTDLFDDVPLPSEPPPDWTLEADPPEQPSHWTELSWLELASTILNLPVKNPQVLYAHIPVTTLLEQDNRTGTVEGAGGGALPAHHARMLLPTADLRRVFVDPTSGVPIGVDPQVIRAHRAAPARDQRLEDLLTPFVLRDVAQPQHDPSGRLRRFIELRDQHCTGIGCSQPAGRCDLDHELAHPAGPTASWNLSAKSARCHRAKHAGWTVTRHDPDSHDDSHDGPQHGHTTWTSPLGHSYTRLSAWLHIGPGSTTVRSLAGANTITEIDLVGHRQAA